MVTASRGARAVRATAPQERQRASVVICTYSSERWQALTDAVESVQRQNDPCTELIVVVDHNPELLARARRELPHAVVVENEGERGLSDSRNTGLAAAQGEIVAFLDDDAVAEPGWFRHLSSQYVDANVMGVGGSVEPRWVDGRPTTFPPEFQWIVGCTYEGMATRAADVRNLIGANMSFRREALERVGGFRSGLGRVGRRPVGCEETELCIRTRQAIPGSRLVFEPAARVWHTVTADRTTPRYFASRCLSEGISKARVSSLTGRRDALSTERGYVLRTLPRGVARGLADAARGDATGLARAAWIVVGLVTTALGYLLGTLVRSGNAVSEVEVMGVDAPRMSAAVHDGAADRQRPAREPVGAFVGPSSPEDGDAVAIGPAEPGPALPGRPDAHLVPEASTAFVSSDQLADRHPRRPLYRRRRMVERPAALDALILEGDTRGSVAVARSLGRSGYSLAVAAGSLSTRHARERARLTDPRTDFEAFTADLIAWLDVHPVRAVLTSGDAGVSVLSQIRGALEPRTRVGIPPPAATALATSKERTLALGAQLGIPIPRSQRVFDAHSAVSAAREIGYPCVLKPSHSWQRTDGAGGRQVRAAFLQGDAMALEAAERLVAPQYPGLVQEYAPGRREAISLFGAAGRVHARFAMVATRSWPPLGGNSVMRVSIAPPRDTLAHAEKLACEAGFDGYSEVEFRRAGDGRPLLMEVNPRFSQSIELAIRSGVDFPRMQLAWMLGERPPPAPERYRQGVRLSWLGGELWGLASTAFEFHDPHPALVEALGSVARDYRRPPNIDGLAWDDPLPILRATAAMSREVAQGAYTRVRGSVAGRSGEAAR